MSKSHDQRCLDSNRFGDGFDCNCEPDWKALYLAAKARIAELERDLEKQKTAFDLASRAADRRGDRIARAVADLDLFFSAQETQQINPEGLEHVERAREALR